MWDRNRGLFEAVEAHVIERHAERLGALFEFEGVDMPATEERKVISDADSLISFLGAA